MTRKGKQKSISMNRRTFLQSSSLATVGTLLIPDFLKAYERRYLGEAAGAENVLVVVQFSGGNDGLNTVVPYRNDVYHRERPRLAIPGDKVLKLNDDLGLNPAMEGLKKLYDDGLLTVINNVGYPNPDRSHFRSMDIWQTASGSDQYLRSGWVGRYLDAHCSGTCAPHDAIEVDDTLSLAMKGERVKALALQNPQKLYSQTQNRFVRQLAEANHGEFGEVDYLYKTLAETVSSAEFIYEKAKVHRTSAAYPESELARRLKTVSGLIQSGVGARVYYVSHGSFDTHVNQLAQQERLLRQYADAVNAFVNDLKKAGELKRVKVLTFSEFGRRVKQNASGGTDHGTANNVFVLNGAKAGVSNEGPNLTDLDDGDLKFSVDFRAIYASLLDDWLGTSSEAVLGRKFAGAVKV